MLTVILAGGKGTRILEETKYRPKAMVTVGSQTILEHILAGYQSQGHKDFLILTGYKHEIIEDHFLNKKNIISKTKVNEHLFIQFPNCKLHLLFTGEDSGTAHRLFLAKDLIRQLSVDHSFMLTYCDGLSSVNFKKLIEFHNLGKRMITVTAVRPKPRYGVLELDDTGNVISMREKDPNDCPMINGGFMVIEISALDFLKPGMDSLEADYISVIANMKELNAYRHNGFWQCMDTLQEREYLQSLMDQGKVPWNNMHSNEDV